MSFLKKYLKLLFLPLCLVLVTSCDSDSSNSNSTGMPATAAAPVMQEYQIEVINLTAGQPFSPIALIGHDNRYQIFNIGEAASAGLERLAEGGDNSDFLTEADESFGVIMSMSTAAPLAPGSIETMTILVAESDVPGMMLSAVTMLVNSNDAFTAANDISIENLEVGDQLDLTTISFDSGTEANTELPGTIPGPADGGEGFNAARDDIADVVRAHSGVVSHDDGLMGSVLNEGHRWDNPVARVIVTRLQ